MTPQERQLIDDLFTRLASLENSPRDPEAEKAIIEGLRRAPNAAYVLVQTALVQDEALKRANARIEELEAHVQPQQAPSGSFLDSMRDAVLGPSQSRGSVPNTGGSRGPVWNSGQVLNNAGINNPGNGGGYADPRNAGYGDPRGAPGYGGGAPGFPGGAPGFGGAAPGGGGGSFLGTAAAAAVGAIGGSLMMNSIRGLMGGNHQSLADGGSLGGGSKNPWSSDQSSGNLARDAGVNDIGKSGSGNDDSRQGLLDKASDDNRDTNNDRDNNDYDKYASNDDDSDDDDDGFDSDGGGDSDYA